MCSDSYEYSRLRSANVCRWGDVRARWLGASRPRALRDRHLFQRQTTAG